MLNDITKNIIIKLILFSLLTSVASATNYYVKNGGNDSNTGLSDAQAWASIDKVISFKGFVSGDIVSFKRNSTFKISSGDGKHSLRAPVSGMRLNTYGTGDRPKISGDGKNSAFRMTNDYRRDNLIIDGLEFRDGATASGIIGSTARENGVTFIFIGSYLTLNDCLFDGASSFENCAIGGSVSGLHIHDITITNCIFQNTQVRAGLYINDADNVLIENCEFLNNHGYDTYENKYEGSGLKFNQGHDTGGGTCKNVIVRNNWFENNHFGLRDGALVDSEIYNNVIIGETVPITNGACIDISTGESFDHGNVRIHNNTIIQRRSQVQIIAVRFFHNTSNFNHYNYDFRNNLIYVEGFGNSSITEYFLQISSVTPDYNMPVLDNNLWYSPENGVKWLAKGTNTTAFSTYQNKGFDENGINVDPLFVNYTNNDFTLREGSPAIELNAGAFEYSNPSPPPIANFTVDKVSPTTEQVVTFTDASNNSPTNWLWSFSPTSVTFQNGTSSSSRNPQIKFNSATVYTCTLRA